MEGSTSGLACPVKSPDLNAIENAYGELSRRLCIYGRQFNMVNELREVRYYEWEKLDITYIRNLIVSFPRFLVDCCDNHDNYTHY